MTEDLDWIVSTARQQDPALDHHVAETLAAVALPLARHLDDPEASEIARQLLADFPEGDASAANAVAVATVDYLRAATDHP